jgi:hypothetical protein
LLAQVFPLRSSHRSLPPLDTLRACIRHDTPLPQASAASEHRHRQSPASSPCSSVKPTSFTRSLAVSWSPRPSPCFRDLRSNGTLSSSSSDSLSFRTIHALARTLSHASSLGRSRIVAARLRIRSQPIAHLNRALARADLSFAHLQFPHRALSRRQSAPLFTSLRASTRRQSAPLTDLRIAPCCALHLSRSLALPIAIFPDLDLPLFIHLPSCFEILRHLIHLLDFIRGFPHPFLPCSTRLFAAARLPSLSSLLALRHRHRLAHSAVIAPEALLLLAPRHLDIVSPAPAAGRPLGSPAHHFHGACLPHASTGVVDSSPSGLVPRLGEPALSIALARRMRLCLRDTSSASMRCASAQHLQTSWYVYVPVIAFLRDA